MFQMTETVSNCTNDIYLLYNFYILYNAFIKYYISEQEGRMDRNSNQPFSIIGIYIHEKCKQRKVLQAGYYSLNDAYEYKNGKVALKGDALSEDFFGKNISISAIVGKNGTGKSSLVEIIFRMISNLWYNIGKDNLESNTKLHKSNFIKDVVADLYFTINGKICKFSCNTYNNNYISVLEFSPKKYDHDFDKKIKTAIELFKNNFFYTIVSNYSMQSYISRDYYSEIQSGEGAWIDSLFHKNDGYSMPIVLNPYRNNGEINLTKEFNFTNDRLISILIEIGEQNKRKNSVKDIAEFFENYSLKDIHYYYNIDINNSLSKLEDFIKAVKNNKNSFAHQFLKKLDLISTIDSDNKLHIIALVYVVNKILNINDTLLTGLEKIYGFTCGYDGIRHSIIGESKVEQEDAKFMLVICSAFINYIIGKNQKTQTDFKNQNEGEQYEHRRTEQKY